MARAVILPDGNGRRCSASVVQNGSAAKQHADHRQHEAGAVAAGEIVQRAGEQRADARADRHAREDDAVDRRLARAREQARAEAGGERAARALADAEQEHVGDQHREARAERHREQQRDAEEGADEADRRGAAVAEAVGEPARARHADHRERAGGAERGRGLERRVADVDEVGDRLDDDQVHAHGGEEHHLHEAPEVAIAQRRAHRPGAGSDAVARHDERRQAGADRSPRHRQRDRQEHEQRRADHLVGVAPAVGIDQRLRERHDQQRPAAEARVGDADRGAEPALEPAADQRRRRHHADRGHAEAAEQADADIELPQRGHLEARK